MGERQKMLIPFGGGLDRKTGSAVVDPDSFGNLQNVHLFRGRMEIRRGLARLLNIGWGDDIIAIQAIRAQSLTAVAVWRETSREVKLYLVDGAFASATYVGVLWTMPALVTGVPVVTCADMYGQLVFAHDEASMAARQVTRVFTVSGGSLANLQLDLDRDGSANDVKFRLVKRHLNYLVGVGYGTDSDEDRPEVIRISQAGAITFVPEHYFLVGARGDPVLGLGKIGQGDNAVLGCYKAAEAYKLVGHDARTFGVFLMDDSHGILGARLEVTVGSENFRWGLNGPRVTSGGASEDLELPLDIAGPEADPLHSAVEADQALAFYDSKEHEVVFVFDHWGYVLHLKDKSRRWSFRPYAYRIGAAGTVYTGTTAVLTLAEVMPSAVYVDPSFSGVDVDDYMPSFDVTWALPGGLVGGEEVEVWVRSKYAGDTPDFLGMGYGLTQDEWKKRATVAITALAATVQAMHFHTNHEIALRVTLGGVPGAGYFGAPDTWPATSRITALAEGTIASFDTLAGFFARDSATQVRRTVVYNGPGTHPNGGTFPLQPQLTTVLEGSDGAWKDVSGGVAQNTSTVVHPHADRHKNWQYRIKVVGPDGESAYVTTAAKWLGPEAPTNVNGDPDLGDIPGSHNEPVSCDYAIGEASDIEFRIVHAPAGVTTTGTAAVGGGTASMNLVTLSASVPAPQTATAGARATMTNFGETDVSEWVDDATPVNEP